MMINELPYKLTTFDNGLRFINVPMQNSDSIMVLVLVGTGSRYETKEINGISHFLEHMMFKGTIKRPGAMDIAHELDSLGADNNAFTSKEYTGYYAKAASENLDTVLDIISDIFQNSKIDPVEVDKERGVIIEEINMRRDDPQQHVGNLFEGLLYGDQPLGWDISGEKETIQTLPRDKFVEYFNSNYFAKNTVVVIAGKFDKSTIEDRVKKYFSNVREHELIKALPVKEIQQAPAIKTFDKKTDQSHFIMGVRGFDRFDDRVYPLRLMSIVLGSGMSSRLFTEVREKRGLAYYVYSSADSYADAGNFAAAAGVDNSRLHESIKVILDEFGKLATTPVSARELEKAKNYIHGKTVIGMETSDSQAVFYGEQELLKSKIMTVEETLARLDAVTSEDILAVAKEIFKNESLNLAIVGPAQDETKLQEILKL